MKVEEKITVTFSQKEIVEAIKEYANKHRTLGHYDLNFYNSEVNFIVDVDKHFSEKKNISDNAISVTMTLNK